MTSGMRCPPLEMNVVVENYERPRACPPIPFYSAPIQVRIAVGSADNLLVQNWLNILPDSGLVWFCITSRSRQPLPRWRWRWWGELGRLHPLSTLSVEWFLRT